ncbi:MAG: signal peptidase I, partial [Lachnospiraceae bacterium]|nr:signal peptidase I [Lachnospiraceae bacterium]
MRGDKKAFQREEVRVFTVIGAIAVAIIVLFGAVLMLNKIPSGSMETTIMTGDLVVSTRYDADDIERYDIVVFYFPDDPELIYIKRVIGLPGETITVENGNVYADGVLLDDSFVNGEMDSSGDGIYEVPEGFYFMLGDNR